MDTAPVTILDPTSATSGDGRTTPSAADRAPEECADAAAAALTDAVVRGDRDAYTRLFTLRCSLVEREATRRLGRRSDLAADAAQEAWIRIARAPRRCPDARSLDGWLRRVVRSAALDLLRSELARRLREERIAASRREAQAFVADVELLESLRVDLASLDGLSDAERSLVELRARTGATLTQLAAMLGLGRAAVDSRLRRACDEARRLASLPTAADGRTSHD